MRFLLDTHCWLWLQVAPERLGAALLESLSDPAHELLLSAASSWEIAIKHRLGKLELPEPPSVYVPSRMASSSTSALPVEHAHALEVSTLPIFHRDPFDRLLIAQARLLDLTLVSADSVFEAYDVKLKRI
ncbi:MAG: type II toxin-antitoxin system VapC family toxin [Deltaproteobacteria bacterium]|nr:type II toxin-antitoxin system VapC family toxin [Deltaproteobacteria bacterium]